jgi:uncharacterized protein (TIGR03435 family)
MLQTHLWHWKPLGRTAALLSVALSRILRTAIGLAALGGIVTVGIIKAPAGRAQTMKPLFFDVVSVKLAGTDVRLWTGLKRSGGRINWTANRITLILYAYRLQGFQLSGIEPENVFYTIDAETNPTATDEQIRLMLQTLLADRFKLAFHRETKQRLGYSLVVAKNGPKLKALKADEKPSALPAFLKNTTLPEGRVISLREGGIVWVGRRVNMSRLSQALTSELHTFVNDKTGLQGDFDVDLKFAPLDPANDAQADDPSIFAAIQDQLGLKLEKETVPVEIVVVDRMEKKPTEN